MKQVLVATIVTEQHVACLTAHVCMNSVKFVLEAPGASIFLGGRVGGLLLCDNVQTHLGGASNEDITVIVLNVYQLYTGSVFTPKSVFLPDRTPFPKRVLWLALISLVY